MRPLKGMIMYSPRSQFPGEVAVLSKAVVCAARRLELSDAWLANLLQIPEKDIPALADGRQVLNPQHSQWLFAISLIRTYGALINLVGRDDLAARWLECDRACLSGQHPLQQQTAPCTKQTKERSVH